MKHIFLIAAIVAASLRANAQSLYFPPVTGTTWDTLSPTSLGWCKDKLDSLINYVGSTNAKAFILLKDGKIVAEKYYGSFTKDSTWYWASAGKTMAAFLMGLAQEDGYLNINDSLPKYLGHPYSACSPAQENAIRIRHQLTMTTGFNEYYGGGLQENHCTADSCLVCIAAPGTRWAYHNAPYTMSHWVIDSAVHQNINTYKTGKLNASTGITGSYFPNGWDDVYFSKPRAFARFGLLMLAKGVWNGATIMHDTAYYNAMINTSQTLNPSYGYLWWLNGKSSYRLPNSLTLYNGMLVPHAPADMYAALGKDDQILNVVPSMNLVMVRMGASMYQSREVANASADSIWVRLNAVFCNNATAVNAANATLALRVFPNPVSDMLFIDSPLPAFHAEVFNMLGALMLSANNPKAIAVSSLSAGIYQLRISSGDVILRTKFVKQ